MSLGKDPRHRATNPCRGLLLVTALLGLLNTPVLLQAVLALLLLFAGTSLGVSKLVADQPVSGLVLLGRLQVVVDQGKASALFRQKRERERETEREREEGDGENNEQKHKQIQTHTRE